MPTRDRRGIRPGSPGVAERAAQDVDQSLDGEFDVGERLADEIVAAAQTRLGAALEPAQRRDEDHRRLGVQRHGAQFLAQVEAVHAGHFHVEEHQVVGLLLEELERLVGVADRRRFQPGFFERMADHAPADDLVVDHEDLLLERLARLVQAGVGEEHRQEVHRLRERALGRRD